MHSKYCPNDVGMSSKIHKTWFLCYLPATKIELKTHNYFNSTGPALLKIKPKYIKTEMNPTKFKSPLDKFLQRSSAQPLGHAVSYRLRCESLSKRHHQLVLLS